MTAEPVVDQIRFTVEQFERMGETFILDPDTRYELLDGVITVMSPAGPRHSGTVNRIGTLFIHRLLGRATVTIQNPVRLGHRSEPQPDITIAKLRKDFYASGHPTAEDIHVAIEVSDSTLRTDRLIKLPLYAKLGVREVWIIDVQGGAVEVCTDPTRTGYDEFRMVHGAEDLAPLAFPDIVITADDLLGEA